MFKTYIFAYFIGLNLMLLKTAQDIYECKSAQPSHHNKSKFQIMFQKNSSPRDLYYIMTLDRTRE